MDNKSKKGPQDRNRINIHEEYELQYWSEKFGVSREQLKLAVSKTGASPYSVEQYLKEYGH